MSGMGTQRWAVWLAVLLVAGGVAGCNSPGTADGPDAADEETEPADEKGPPVAERVLSQVHVEIAGARTLTWDGRQEVVLTRAGGPGESVNLLAGGFEVPELLPEDPRTRFRWAFDLVGDYADEPGSFTLAGPGPDPNAAASAAFVIVMRVTDGSKPEVTEWEEVEFLEQYNQAGEPCSLELGENHRSGTLRCPTLTEEGGKTVSLLVTWEEA